MACRAPLTICDQIINATARDDQTFNFKMGVPGRNPVFGYPHQKTVRMSQGYRHDAIRVWYKAYKNGFKTTTEPAPPSSIRVEPMENLFISQKCVVGDNKLANFEVSPRLFEGDLQKNFAGWHSEGKFLAFNGEAGLFPDWVHSQKTLLESEGKT